MSLSIAESVHEKVHVFALTGSLDTGTADDLTRAVTPAFDAGAADVLFDLAGVKYVTSAGLAAVLAAYRRAKAAGGRVRVCGLTPLVKKVFDLSGLTARLDMYPDAAAALAAG